MSLADIEQAGHPENDGTSSSAGSSNVAVAEPETNDSATCPKCGYDSSWGAASWCPQCGYYPGVFGGMGEVVPEPEEEEAPKEQKKMIPTWLQILLGGLFAVGAISMGVKYFFYYTSGNQGQWAIFQSCVGLLMMAGAQLSATVIAMRVNDDLSLADGLTSPFEIWRATLEKLPTGYLRLCCASWGLMILIMAVFFIGGIDYSSFFPGEPTVYDPTTRSVEDMIAQGTANAKLSGDKQAKEEEDEADYQPKIKELPLPSARTPMSCTIYGYMKDGQRDFGRLLLAASVNGKWKHVGEIEADGLPIEVRRGLFSRFDSMHEPRPFVTSPFKGVWVKPGLSLNVKFKGWTIGGRMIDPIFVGGTN